MVNILTDEEGRNRRERKQKTNYKLKNVLNDYEGALIVKVCDRLFNVSYSIATNNTSKMKMYLAEHDDFYSSAFRSGVCDDLWDRLNREILTISCS